MGQRKGLAIFLVGTLLAAMAPMQMRALAIPPDAGTHKITVDNTDTATLATLKQQGATQLVDYGSFSLWKVSDTQRTTLASQPTVAARDDFDRIHLRGATLVTPNGAPPVAANLRQSQTSGKQLWLVQFVGPTLPKWLDNLRASGIEPVIYMPNNAYVVWLDGGQLTKLESSVPSDPTLQFTGAYHPEYRLDPSLREVKGDPDQLVPVTVQFYKTAAVTTSVANLRTLGKTVLRDPEEILNFVNISLEVPAKQLASIAGEADVFNIEPYAPPKKLDEAQGQIVAGNLTTSGGNVVPSGPGYLAWLQSKGFPTDPAQYPIVDVVDDGIDNGTITPLHPDFHQGGVAANSSRIVFNANCTVDAAADGKAGHGNLNAGIVGAYDKGTATSSVDANGYNIGLGVSPYTRIAGTKIFNNAGSYDIGGCGNNDAGVVANAYTNGATFTSDSFGADTAGRYDASAQAYDSLTRDASAVTPGNQQMLHVFAAGNAGSGVQTVGSPGTAKNVLTVGATENVREDGYADGCALTTANNADDIASFSSRGPAADGRAKPEIVAPGTHIEGPASQDPGYDGTGVCGDHSGAGIDAKYHPQGQTLYTWSSGTSHSTPALAGAASLIYNYYGRVLAPGQTPSPAMLKALILNTPRYLTGVAANDTLPSPNQGWGDVNLGALFDGTPRFLLDQSQIFTATGQTYLKSGKVMNTAKPLRITLVWTDAPGSTTGGAYVNDLNLEVVTGGRVYKGNVFSGANSTPGGAADAKNNTENIFLPAGTSGTFSVKVTAANIAGDGTKSGAPSQDFALVIADGDFSTPVSVLGAGGVNYDDVQGGNRNGILDPGETIGITVPISNTGTLDATGVTATLSTTSAGVQLLGTTASYPVLTAGTSVGNTSRLTFHLSEAAACGTPLALTITLKQSDGTAFPPINLSIPVGGTTLGASVNYASTDVPKAIPDNNPTGITSALTVATTGTVGKVRVHVNITHTWDGDLIIKLLPPVGSPITLVSRRGSSGDNFTGTTLDDAATTPISSGTAPFAGTYRPEQPLSAANGQAINGSWMLSVSDNAAADVGTLTGWSLDIQPAIPVCSVYTGPSIFAVSQSGGALGASTPITITGLHFPTTVSVSFGSQTATNVRVVSDTKITAVTPPGTSGGAVDVSVSTADSIPVTVKIPGGFVYGAVQPAPTVTPPTAAPPVGGSTAQPGGTGRPTAAPPAAGAPTPNPLPPRR